MTNEHQYGNVDIFDCIITNILQQNVVSSETVYEEYETG